MMILTKKDCKRILLKKEVIKMDEVIFEYNSVEVTPSGLVLINVNE